MQVHPDMCQLDQGATTFLVSEPSFLTQEGRPSPLITAAPLLRPVNPRRSEPKVRASCANTLLSAHCVVLAESWKEVQCHCWD